MLRCTIWFPLRNVLVHFNASAMHRTHGEGEKQYRMGGLHLDKPNERTQANLRPFVQSYSLSARLDFGGCKDVAGAFFFDLARIGKSEMVAADSQVVSDRLVDDRPACRGRLVLVGVE